MDLVVTTGTSPRQLRVRRHNRPGLEADAPLLQLQVVIRFISKPPTFENAFPIGPRARLPVGLRPPALISCPSKPVTPAGSAP